MDKISVPKTCIQLTGAGIQDDQACSTYFMCKHEEKYCPACNAIFECKVGDVANCQCNTVKLSDSERKYIASKYTDCLCAECMLLLKRSYNLALRESELAVFFRGR